MNIKKLNEDLSKILNEDDLYNYHALVVIKKGAQYTESMQDFKDALIQSLEEYFTGEEYIINDIEITDEGSTLSAEIYFSTNYSKMNTRDLRTALYDEGIYNWSKDDFEQVVLRLNK